MSHYAIRTALAIASATFCLSQPASASTLFEGDVKLACEAILCLSSGSRPDECTPSLQRFFSIRHKKAWETIQARHDFLRQCPSANQDARMQSLVAAMANAAGSCQASRLNAMLAREKEVTVCEPRPNRGSWRWVHERNEEPACTTPTVRVVDNTLPYYCKAYYHHDYVAPGDLRPPRYVGEPEKGGRWQD